LCRVAQFGAKRGDFLGKLLHLQLTLLKRLNMKRLKMTQTVILLIAVSMSSFVFAAELNSKSASVYGQNIHYSECGSGDPLVLLHGLWGGLNEWQPILDPLCNKYRVLVMDFLGFHGSDKPDTTYHNALLAEFLVGFLRTLQLKDVTLIGHAMGANTATYTAVHHPERIAALVLVDGAGYRNPDRDIAAAPGAGMLRFRRIATGSSLTATRGLLERRVFDPTLVTDNWVEEAFSLWVNSAKAIGDMLTEGGDVTESEMQSIALPTLIVWGADDRVFPIDNAERLKNDIETSTMHIIEDSGHLPQLEQTDEFLDALLPFLENR